MRTFNTKESKSFVVAQIFWLVVFAAFYKLMFRCIGSFTYKESKTILCFLVFVLILGGVCLELKKRRNDFSIFANLAIPYGIYTSLSYFDIRRRTITIVLIVCLILTLLYSTFVLMQKVKNKRYIKKIFKRRIQWVVASTQSIFTIGFSIIIFSIAINLVLENTILQSTVTSTISEADNEEYSLKNNIDALTQLDDGVWKTLSLQDKLDLMQLVANIEQRYLGTYDLNVEASITKGCCGYYDDGKHKIVINLDHLKNDESWQVLDTLAHEAYHAYQHRLVDLYEKADTKQKQLIVFRSVKEYSIEFKHYNSGEDNFEEYYNQKCEEKARKYAEEAVADYHNKIMQYIEENGKEISGE